MTFQEYTKTDFLRDERMIKRVRIEVEGVLKTFRESRYWDIEKGWPYELLEALSAPTNLLGIFCQHLHAGE
jgi:hypothetical protein